MQTLGKDLIQRLSRSLTCLWVVKVVQWLYGVLVSVCSHVAKSFFAGKSHIYTIISISL